MKIVKVLALSLVVVIALFSIDAFLGKNEVHAVKDPVCDGSPGGGPYGRCWVRGYFTNEARHSTSGLNGGNDLPWPPYHCYRDVTGLNNCWVYPSNVQNGVPNVVENFIAYHAWALNLPLCTPFCPTDKTQAWYDWRRLVIGSAWTIDVMMGYPGYAFGSGDSGIINGVNTAKARFNEWADLMRGYSAAGLIDWNAWRVYGNHTNTTSVGVNYNGRDINAFWYGFYGEGPEFVDGIVFKHPVTGADQFVINRTCLNAIGEKLGLAPVNFENRAEIIQVPPGGTVVRGKTYTLTARLNNQGNAPSPDVSMVVRNVNTNLTKNPRTAFQSTPAANQLGYTTAASECKNHQDCWYWRYSGGLPIGQQRVADFEFTVNDNATLGSQICFIPYAVPRRFGIAEFQGTQVCVTVEDPSKPFVSTENGDVHAGANFATNPCFDPNNQTLGEIRGRLDSGKGSKATYAVSAGADINNFGSADEANTNNKLTFGNVLTTGQYGVICRADIAAQKLADTSIPAAPNIIDQAQINSFSGPFVKVTGNLVLGTGSSLQIPKGKYLTIVVDGNVHIKNNVGYDNTNFTKLEDIPSFAVVAKRNIFIDPAVTSLDGIYSAGTKTLQDPGDGVIDTCRNAIGAGTSSNFSPLITAVGGASQCGNQLTVNGMLVAHEMYFRRTFGDVKTTNASELIKLNGMLYLSPPPGFGELTQSLRFSGDRPPVF